MTSDEFARLGLGVLGCYILAALLVVPWLLRRGRGDRPNR